MTLPRIAIVGDGLLAWLAAATLRRALGQGAAIAVVSTGRALDGLGATGAAVVAPPEFLRESPVADLLPGVVGASFGLGMAFSGWAGSGAWFLPFGETGAPIGSVPFHQVAARLRAAGATVRLADHSLGAMAAQAGRFALPSPDPRSPLSTLDFALHLPTDALTAVLRGADESAPLAHVQTNDGRIAALDLADESRIEADLYLDCTGNAALLIGGALGEPFESWRHWFPCDRVVTHVVPDGDAPPVYALHQAHAAGWSASIPLDGAMTTVEFRAGTSDGRPFESGLRRAPWCGNCVAIGSAAAAIEPLFATPLTLAQRALDRLVRLLPGGSATGVEAIEYNRIAASEAERARDMALALYQTNRRTGEPYWDAQRAVDLPDLLARKLDLYTSRGALPVYDDELFETADWAVLLDGMGLRPRRIDPFAAAIPLDRAEQHCAWLRERLVATLETMPPHGQILARMRSERA